MIVIVRSILEEFADTIGVEASGKDNRPECTASASYWQEADQWLAIYFRRC